MKRASIQGGKTHKKEGKFTGNHNILRMWYITESFLMFSPAAQMNSALM